MAVVALNATPRGGLRGGVHGLGGAVHIVTSTVEVGAADTNASVYTFARIPSNARIHGLSQAFWDDLASAGAPTIDFGFFPVNGNITSQFDALNDGLDVATANATGKPLVKDIANYGLKAWQYLTGGSAVTADPGGAFDLKGTLQDAAVNVGGTVTVHVVYTVD